MTIWKLIARFVSKPKVADYLIRRAMKTPFSHLPTNEDPSYMERYWLFNPYPISSSNRKPWQFPWSIRIHHIKREDYDRELHDHPWNARTIILKGHYIETRLNPNYVETAPGKFDPWVDEPKTTTHWRREGDTATLAYAEYHTIEEVSDGGVWTMFITGPWRGVWGFLVDGVKVPWKTYLGLESEQAAVEPPHSCMFCGAPSWVDPSDQCAPPDYCHEGDHGNREDYEALPKKTSSIPRVVVQVQGLHDVAYHTGGFRVLGNNLDDQQKAMLNAWQQRQGVRDGGMAGDRPGDREDVHLMSRSGNVAVISSLHDLEKPRDPTPAEVRHLLNTIDCGKDRKANKVLRTTGMRPIRHPLTNITEWRRGCSCASENNPAECQECTVGLIEAIEEWFKWNEGQSK